MKSSITYVTNHIPIIPAHPTPPKNQSAFLQLLITLQTSGSNHPKPHLHKHLHTAKLYTHTITPTKHIRPQIKGLPTIAHTHTKTITKPLQNPKPCSYARTNFSNKINSYVNVKTKTCYLLYVRRGC